MPLPQMQRHIFAFQSILRKAQKVEFLCCTEMCLISIPPTSSSPQIWNLHCSKMLCRKSFWAKSSPHAATMHLRLEPVLMATIWKFLSLSINLLHNQRFGNQPSAQATARPGEILTDCREKNMSGARSTIVDCLDYLLLSVSPMHCIFGARGRRSEIM